MNKIFILAAAVAVSTWTGISSASAALYTFEADAFSASSPFSSTDAGLTATFAGSNFADPNAFTISYNSTSGPLPLYAGLTGAFLTTSAFSLDLSSPLTITFSAPVSALQLNFALGGRVGSLSLATNASGTATKPGMVPTGYQYAEGVLSYAGPAFTVATLSTAADGLAVDNINATVAASRVPEPASLGVLGVGLAGLALRRRRA